MRGFEDGPVGTDVRARRHAQAADQAGRQIAQDVAVQVRQHEHVVQLGLLHQLHAHVVDDAVLELDVGDIPWPPLRADFEQQPVGVLHDVGLVDAGDFLAARSRGRSRRRS